MLTLALAMKNLGRNRARTALSLLAVALGVAIIVIARSYTEGLIDGLINNQIRVMSGHIRIMDPEYAQKERLLSLTMPVEGYEDAGLDQMLQELGGLEDVKVVSPRIRFGALVAKDQKTEGILGIGLDPQADDELANLSQYVEKGRWLEGGREVVVGTRLLNKMGLEVGDELTVVANTAFSSLKASSYKIVGEIESGLRYLDEGTLLMELGQAQSLLEMPGQVTEILLGLGDGGGGRAISVANTLEAWQEKTHGESRYTIVPWQKSSPLIESILMEQVIFNEIYVLIALLSAFVVFNTMMMVVNERRREIGMLKALGMTRREIIKVLMGEGLFISTVGGLIGMILGGLVTYYFSKNPIDIGAMMEGIDKSFLVLPKFTIPFDPVNLIYAFFIGVVVTMAAVYLPARRGAKMAPTEALRSL